MNRTSLHSPLPKKTESYFFLKPVITVAIFPAEEYAKSKFTALSATPSKAMWYTSA